MITISVVALVAFILDVTVGSFPYHIFCFPLNILVIALWLTAIIALYRKGTASPFTKFMLSRGATWLALSVMVVVDLVEYACQFIGNPYVWGGTSLTKGADCSGFVLSVFKNYGYTLPHYSVSQSQCGTKISEDELLPGDLVFYSNGSRINHVAIYIGGGQVVHASSPKTGIRTSSYRYRTPVKFVRIIED